MIRTESIGLVFLLFAAVSFPAAAQHDWFDPDYEYEHTKTDGVGYEKLVANGHYRNFAPIHVAAARGDVETVMGELAEGVPADLAVVNSWKGVTPLLIACEFGRVEVVRALLDAGADVNQEVHGRTPLMIAAGTIPTIGGNPTACVEELLARGAEIGDAIFTAAGGERGFIFIPDGALSPEKHVPSPFEYLRPRVGGSIGGMSPRIEEIERARLGDASRLKILIEHGADVNRRGDRGRTPLINAAATPDPERVRLLLEAGADITATLDNGWGAVMEAARSGDAEVLRVLLEAGATSEPISTEYGTWTAMDLAARWGWDANEKVQLLIDAGVGITAGENERGPLLIACEWSDGTAIRPLLEAGADPTQRDGDGNSLLVLASASSLADGIAALLEHGEFDVNERGKGDSYQGATPLILAAGSDNDAVAKIRLLAEHGADLSLTTVSGISVLHAAAREGQMDVVVALAEAGADVNEPYPIIEENERGGGQSPAGPQYTPLMLVAYRGEDSTFMSEQTGEEAARALIAHGADLNASLESGATAVTFALQAEQPEVVKILLDAGAEPDVQIRSDEGDGFIDETSSLFLAIEYEEPEGLAMLLAAGADSRVRMGYRGTPLHYACSTGNPELVRVLLEAGADVNAGAADYRYRRDSNVGGMTALMVAARNDDNYFYDRSPLEVVRLLLEHGADAGARDDAGRTAITFLCEEAGSGWYEKSEYLEAARLLLEHGADIRARDRDGLTPLHYAARGASRELIDLLLEAGADLRALDKRGRNALDFARTRWHKAQWSVPSLVYLEELLSARGPPVSSSRRRP